MAWVGDRYRLVERLGTGGMSVVWRAFDEVLGRPVAVKVLAGDYASKPEFRKAIRREARAAARLTHPHVGVVYDYGESRTESGELRPYVVMELVDGPAMNARLHGGPMPWREALGVCAQIAAGLGAAHARGLVHRDVKPANVILSSAGAKVVDFGISAVVGEEADRAPDGHVLGTPAYVAPERLTGAPVGTAADVYALGVVLFKALTGRSPWPGDTAAQVVAAHLTGEPEPLPAIDGMPDEVNELYRRCLAKDPAQRPGAEEAAGVLAAAAGLATGSVLSVTVPLTAVAPPRAAGGEPTTLLPGTDNTAPVAVHTPAAVGPATQAMDPLADQEPVRTGRAPLGTWLLATGRRRRTAAALAGLPLAGLLAGVIVTSTEDHHTENQAAPVGGVAASTCAVTYQVGTDDGSTFTGTLKLDAGRPEPPGGWSVSFDLPGAQTFQAAAPATSTQDGSHVVVWMAGSEPLGAQFTGTYLGANPLPAIFTADGRACAPTLIGSRDRPAPAPSAVDGSVGTVAQHSGAGQGQTGGHGDGSQGKGKDKGKGKG